MIYSSEKTIDSFNDYVDFVKKYKQCNHDEIWFRGQRDNQWLLDSTLDRDKKIIYPDEDIYTLRYELGINFLKELEYFKEQVADLLPSDFNDFHFTFLGQHYGLKTPVMDWTTDPLVALFFAIDGYDIDSGNSPIIFILKPGLLNKYSRILVNGESIAEPLIIDDYNVNSEGLKDWYTDPNKAPFGDVPFAIKSKKEISHRISRQSGTFTLMSPVQPLNFPWIQRKIYGESFGISIEINPKAVNEIRETLSALDITKDTIYGTDSKNFEKLCKDAIEHGKIK